MDKDEIIDKDEVMQMARQAGGVADDKTVVMWHSELEAFAKLVAEREREAIIDLVAMYGGPVDLEAAVRARGQQ